MSKETLSEIAKSVLRLEADAVNQMIDGAFVKACDLVLGCDGRVVVIGIGKSGHIAGKIASTLASTGTPAFFVHPGEASHGDLGMITPADLVLSLVDVCSGSRSWVDQPEPGCF